MLLNLTEKLNKYFNAEISEIFELISKTADANNFNIYIVGGIVRDILLDNPNSDIDLLVEGDALEFIKLLPNIEILQTQPDLHTAKILFNNSIEIDFASTRREEYPKKGHMPAISEIGVNINTDAMRRDFTINTLLISLNKENYGELIDPLGGMEDLKNKKLHILHDDSFIDDPTRIIRGLKFATRFGFDLDDYTLNLQKKYLENINHDMCYSRIKSELQDTFSLNSSEIAFNFLRQKIYKLISENINKEIDFRTLSELIRECEITQENIWIIYFAVIFAHATDAFESLPFQYSNTEKEIIILALDAYNAQENLGNTNSAIYSFFANLPPESILIFYIFTLERKALHYLGNLSKITPDITGNDLIALGLEPSPTFKTILTQILYGKIDGRIRTRDDEIAFAKAYISQDRQ